MQQAFALRKSKQLYLFASAWTIPSWMRYSPGYTIVKKTHYQVYAEYYRKYFDEYAKRGVKFWGMTTQNEANSGLTPGGIAGVYWVPQELVSFSLHILLFFLDLQLSPFFKVLVMGLS